jgi:hypothetical protein
VNYKGLVVELICILWQYGYLKSNKLLQRVHSYWFDDWVAFKTQQTMTDVDRQIKEMVEPSGVDKPVYSETPEGEMRLKAPWLDD